MITKFSLPKIALQILITARIWLNFTQSLRAVMRKAPKYEAQNQ
ncbi:hypothetical protein [Nostoc sp. CMAA1605]|nr:hypothetical protein [Nostoc sp. CMAA1605]